MNKFIRIMAILSTALVALSLVLILVSVLFQPVLFRLLYGFEDTTFVFPWGVFMNCLLRCVCIALLIICCGNKKGGIWLELVLFFAMMLVLPMLSNATELLLSSWLGSVKGVTYMGYYHMATKYATWCTYPAGWGQALAYMTCGMSIVYKKMSKAASRSLSEE